MVGEFVLVPGLPLRSMGVGYPFQKFNERYKMQAEQDKSKRAIG
jgi:hypothetical protein